MKHYIDRDWLFQRYIVDKLSQKSIGILCEVDQSTIHKYLVRFKIPRRTFSETASGSRSPNWKGGRTRTTHGYIHIRMPSHQRAKANGYVPEQIIIAERALNRRLSKKEVIHHINERKDDNRLENLYLFESKEAHNCYHTYLRHHPESSQITQSNLLSMNG